jgi:putative hemolysin
MKTSTRTSALFFSAFAISLLDGCSFNQKSSLPTAIANPASEYCIQKGGKIAIVQGEFGEKGMCHVPDGTVVDEWELFRREHPQR